MNGTSGTKGNRLNLLKSNRSKIIFICPLRHVGQEMFHEADEILTNVTSPLRFDSHKSSSLSLPCGRKIYSSVKCYLLTEKYEIWKYSWKFSGSQTMTHLTHQSSLQDLKQKKAKRVSVVKRFLSTPVPRSRSNTGKERLRKIFWAISHLWSRALNVISSRTCIAFLWDINCLLFPLFPALITVFCREQNFKF